jgi:hypothetical protein
MTMISIKSWSVQLSDEVMTYPDFLLHRLASSGLGRIEAEWRGDEADVAWQLVPRLTGVSEEIAQLPARLFRVALARIATVAGISPYGGHAVFGVATEPGWPAQGVHFFTLFLCNEPTMGFWLKLYLYNISG